LINQPKPSQEEIKRRIREREWLAYQRRGKQSPKQLQDSPRKQLSQEVPREILKRKQPGFVHIGRDK